MTNPFQFNYMWYLISGKLTEKVDSHKTSSRARHSPSPCNHYNTYRLCLNLGSIYTNTFFASLPDLPVSPGEEKIKLIRQLVIRSLHMQVCAIPKRKSHLGLSTMWKIIYMKILHNLHVKRKLNGGLEGVFSSTRVTFH